MLKFFFVFVFFFSACQINSDQIKARYKMISYESKALVDSTEFPVIEIFDNNSFKIYKKNVLEYHGKVETNSDTVVFNESNGISFSGVFIDKEKNILRVSRLVSINIEANFGNFKKIK